VTIRYGAPMTFKRSVPGGREQAQLVAEQVLARVRALYAGM
jgi:hypothetical protein